MVAITRKSKNTAMSLLAVCVLGISAAHAGHLLEIGSQSLEQGGIESEVNCESSSGAGCNAKSFEDALPDDSTYYVAPHFRNFHGTAYRTG